MNAGADELINRAREHRQNNRLDEALVAALAATKSDPDNSDAWWQVALARLGLGDKKKATEALRKVVSLDPGAEDALARLGAVLAEDGNLSEAKEMFLKSLDLEPDNTTAIEGLLSIYRDEDSGHQHVMEIALLQKLDEAKYLTVDQINRLGNLFYTRGEYQAAAACWQKDDEFQTNSFIRVNLALALTKIGQTSDAIDMWRIATNDKSFEAQENHFKKETTEALVFATMVRNRNFQLPASHAYSKYLNPFVLLGVAENAKFEEFDPKAIQKARKRMLQELELEDGKLTWMPDIVIDRSHAMGLADELQNENLKDYHWQVFQDKALLGFLSRGSLDHFIVEDDESSRTEIVERLEYDPGFAEWLGKIFAPQYDAVLTKIIDLNHALLLKTIRCGRRWVPASMVDLCYPTTRKAISTLIEPVRELAKKSKSEIITFEVVEQKTRRVFSALNSIPMYIEDLHDDLASQIRTIFIETADLYVSQKILTLASLLEFKSIGMTKLIEKDAVDIGEMISRQKSEESHLTFGKDSFSITHEGVRRGAKFIPIENVSSIRYGIIVSSENSRKTYDLCFCVKDSKKDEIVAHWKASDNLEQHEKFFHGVVNASSVFLVPTIIKRYKDLLDRGNYITIGKCTINKSGIQYTVKGWFLESSHEVPWRSVRTDIENGDVIVFDAREPKKRTAMSLRDTDNASILMVIIRTKSAGG